jgi:hypothetical protein
MQQQTESRADPNASERQTADASIPLVGGESVLVDARPAWSAYSLQLLLAALFLVLGVVGGPVGGVETMVTGAVVAGMIVGFVWYQRRRIRYVITDRRVVKVTGVSSKTTNEAWMEDVRGLQTGASLTERLLDHGHITISDSILRMGLGRFQGMRLGGIKDYEKVATVIRKRQNQRKSNDY